MAKRKQRKRSGDAAADTRHDEPAAGEGDASASDESDASPAPGPADPDAPVDWDRIGREDELDDSGADGTARTPHPDEAPPTGTAWRSRRILGAIMSVTVPGTGHLAIDRPIRGLAWFIAASLVMLLFAIDLKWFIIGIAVTFVGAALDVGFSRPGRRLREWILICLVWFAGFMVFGQIRGRVEQGWATGFQVRSAAMSPNIRYLERVVSYRRDKGGPGFVVGFDFPCMPGQRLASRIIAVAGDSVEVRCGRAYVNGRAIDREEIPGTCEFNHPNVKEKRFEKRACKQFRESIGSSTYHVVEQDAQFADQDALEFPVKTADGTFASPRCQGEHKRDVTAASLARGTVKTTTAGGAADQACALRAAYVVPANHVFVLNDNRANADDSRRWGPVPASAVVGKITQVWWSEAERGLRWSRLGHRVR